MLFLTCTVVLQTLRVQSSEGTARIDVLDTEVTAQLFERIYETLHLSSYGFTLHKDRQRKDEITSSKSRRLIDYGLKHGDMLFLSPVNGAVLFDQPTTSAEVSIPLDNLTICLKTSLYTILIKRAAIIITLD